MKMIKTIRYPLNYTNNFNDEGHKLTTDFQYSYGREVVPTTIVENNTFPDNQLLGE